MVASALALVCASPAPMLAAPGQDDTVAAISIAQNVDYIGPEAGATLDLGFPVLVPSWVPEPFGGSPDIDSGGGYYSLYWMNAGGEPTFLHVTGQVGGALPAGSPYDLNVQLFINSEVQGYGAIHDVTPAYDTVWWIANGVLYKVESRNSSTDSVTLANSLIRFIPPMVMEPEPEPEPTATSPDEEPIPDPVTPETGGDSGGSTTSPPDESGVDVPAPDEPDLDEQAPDVGADDSGVEPASGVGGTQPQGGSTSDDETAAEPETSGATAVPSDGTGETIYASDGTGGAQNLVVGSDGTGGTIDVTIPRSPAGPATP